MPHDDLPSAIIYTDGGCNPNPGPGGWAAILRLPDADRELSGSEAEATNNRMELRAALEALRALPCSHRVELYTDSRYLQRGVTEWLPGWIANRFRVQDREIKNRDLWEPLARELERHQITWRWTKGHAGDPWNERADQLARAAIPAKSLPLDDKNAVHVLTAAAYLGRARKGGWGVILSYRTHRKSLSGAEKATSANRMHLRAAIEGLRAIQRPLPIHIYTASDYLINGAVTWVKGWAANGWVTKDGKDVSNRDLWEELAALGARLKPAWHVVSSESLPEPMLEAKRIATEAAKA